MKISCKRPSGLLVRGGLSQFFRCSLSFHKAERTAAKGGHVKARCKRRRPGTGTTGRWPPRRCVAASAVGTADSLARKLDLALGGQGTTRSGSPELIFEAE